MLDRKEDVPLSLVGEITVEMRGGGLVFVGGVGGEEDGGGEGIGVGGGFALGEVVQLEGHAVDALVEDGDRVEEARVEKVFDYLAISHSNEVYL